MKILSFLLNDRPTWGVLTSQGVVHGASLFPQLDSISAMLTDGSVEKIRGAVDGASEFLNLEELELLPVIPQPGKIFCVGVNYHAHRIEAGREETAYPPIFMRVSTSQTAHNSAICRPRESTELDFEGEIAIVIGLQGRRIKRNSAWDHIAGYAPYNDGSIRDWQRHTHQWGPGKNFDRTAGFGPWMTTRDEIEDGQVLTLITRLNGIEVQRTTTDLLIFSIPEIIEYISSFCTLMPGDVIVTGTPGGVGFKRSPPLFMKPGDICEVEVSNVGVLVNTIEDY